MAKLARASLLALAAPLLAACFGAQVQTDDAAFHAAVSGARAGEEVTFDAVSVAAPQFLGDHEVLVVRAATGETVEVDYNTSLGQTVPVHPGDHLIVQGALYIDPGRIGVHCIHAHTSSGCPLPGFILLNGQAYQ